MDQPQIPDSSATSRTAFPPFFYWASLVPLFLASRLLDQWLTDQTFVAMNATSNGVQLLFLYGVLTFITGAFLPVLATLIVFKAWRLRAQSLNSTFNQVVKEELRAFGSILNWSFLLILPGLWKMIEYVFVPWVVALDPDYEEGRVDALKESRRLFYRVWGRLVPFVLFTTIVVPLVLTSFDEYRSFEDHPFTASGMSLLDLGLFIVFQYVLLKIWRRARYTAPQPS